MGLIALLFLVPAAQVLAASVITLATGNDLVFNNFFYSPVATVEEVAAGLSDPALRGAGPQDVWSFEPKLDTKSVGIRADDIAMQFDIAAPFDRIIHINLPQVALMPGRTELAVIRDPAIVTPSLRTDLTDVAPYFPIRAINVNLTSLPFAVGFADFGHSDFGYTDFGYSGDSDWYGTEAPEPGVLALVAAGLGLTCFRRQVSKLTALHHFHRNSDQ